MPKPDFLLIGAAKAGTTSAYHTLSHHPEIHIRNEPHFFDRHRDITSNQLARYERKFRTRKRIAGEKTPSYCYLRHAIDGIHKTYPEIRLMLILREPITRAFSHWRFRKQVGRIEEDFRTFCEKEAGLALDQITKNGDYAIARGRYIEMIDYILTKFRDAQLHLAIAEDIKNDPLESYNRMFRFLGCRDLAPEELEVDFNVNRTRYQGTIPPQDFAWLYKIYQPLNERLYQL